MSYASEVLADSPYLWWRLDEASGAVAADSSGNARDGTLTGTSSGFSYGEPGAVAGNDALGITSRFIINATTFNVSNASVELWYNYSGTPPAGNSFLGGGLQGNFGSSYDKCIILTTAGKVMFYIYDGAAKQTSVTGQSALSAGWHHLVGVADGTTVTMYIDGVAAGTVAATTTYTGYTGSNLMVSGDPNLDFDQINGTWDEFAVYSTALSAARVAVHYAAAFGSGTTIGSFRTDRIRSRRTSW